MPGHVQPFCPGNFDATIVPGPPVALARQRPAQRQHASPRQRARNPLRHPSLRLPLSPPPRRLSTGCRGCARTPRTYPGPVGTACMRGPSIGTPPTPGKLHQTQEFVRSPSRKLSGLVLVLEPAGLSGDSLPKGGRHSAAGLQVSPLPPSLQSVELASF